MHGLGNDFVMLDGRQTAARPAAPSAAARIAHRQLGIGCDQLIVLEPPTDRDADVFMRIYNPDGGEAGACGNATRCVASVLMDERKTDQVTVQTISGLLELQKTGKGANGLPVISVDMGLARLDWREIPVAGACDTNHLPVGAGSVAGSGRHQHGQSARHLLRRRSRRRSRSPSWGRSSSTMPFFPRARQHRRRADGRQGPDAAAGLGARRGPDARLRLGRLRRRRRRGRRGLVDRKAEVVLEHGTLTIEWLRDGHVMMTGGICARLQG